jgi:hypothetical protein
MNKKLTYVLIPLVAVVWGLIFYKIYLQINGADDEIKTYALKQNSLTVVPSDTARLKLNYRDPFLSYSFNHVAVRMSGFASSLQNTSVVKTPDFVWPAIKYGGMIVNSKTKRKTGLIDLENSNLLVKEGEEVKGYKVVQLFADSVVIRYAKHKKTFIR